MRKKLVRHGNSYAFVIDKPIMELLHLDPEGSVEARTDGEWLMLRSAPPAGVDDEFMAQVEELHARHSATLKKLAE